MSAKFAAPLLGLSLAACAASIPIQQTPRQLEKPIAPIDEAGPLFASTCEDWDEWDKPAYPVRIHGNAFLVGTCGIASVLITGTNGHILIDSGTEAGADLVLRNIRRLGFDPADIKVLLHSHEHYDHVGGMARLQQVTGAELYASADAAKAFESGLPIATDPQAGMHEPFPIARVDRVISGGDTIRVGNLALTAIATPGHSPGALSWHWGSCEGAECNRIVYADSLSPVSADAYKFSDHPAYLTDYRASLTRIEAIPCDILITPHPSASNMLDRMAGRAPWIDSEACENYAAALRERLEERIQKEQGE